MLLYKMNSIDLTTLSLVTAYNCPAVSYYTISPKVTIDSALPPTPDLIIVSCYTNRVKVRGALFITATLLLR